MKTQFQKAAGVALLIGSFLMFITMVLHPVGGSFEQILRVRTMGMIAHSIALVSIPFTWVGFWGITKRLDGAPFFSRTAFSFMTFGLVAVMIAAALNGLVLTEFVSRYAEASPEVLDTIRPILYFNGALNHAFDYIFMGAMCISVLLWSIAILKTKAFPIWLGWLGGLLSVLAMAMWVIGFVFVDLHGFRLFIFGSVAWIVAAGVFLVRVKKE